MEEFFDSEEDKKVITGTYAVFNGKKYEACFVKSDRVTFQDEKLVEIYSKEPVEEDGFEKYGFGKYLCYKKIVDIEELSEFYNIKEVCDYMGQTFPIVRKDGDTIRIFTQDPSFETKGFIQDGRDGFVKEIQVSDAMIRYVKNDYYSTYMIGKLLRDRMGDEYDKEYAFGILGDRSKIGIRGYFQKNESFFIYEKDPVGYMTFNYIIGPFNKRDIVYACALQLGKENLFEDYRFDQAAQDVYDKNRFGSYSEFKKTIRMSQFPLFEGN